MSAAPSNSLAARKATNVRRARLRRISRASLTLTLLTLLASCFAPEAWGDAAAVGSLLVSIAGLVTTGCVWYVEFKRNG